MENIFCERLRIVRELRGLSQTELADKARLQPSAISHFETGRRAPSFDNLKKLANALSISVDYLLGRTPDMDVPATSSQGLFRHYSQMSAEDQSMLEDLASRMAKRNVEKQEKGS